MARNDNYGLPPTVTQECPHCKSLLQIWQRWVTKTPKTPDPCPVCREDFLKVDDGIRWDSTNERDYKVSNYIEYVMIKRLRKGPRVAEPTE